MKKIIIFIITIVVLILAVLFIRNNIFKYDYNIVSVNELNYFLSKQDNKFGVINKKGDILLENKYESIIIPNPEKDLFVCYDGNKTIILNSKSEQLFSDYEEIQPIKLKNVANALAYEKSTLVYKKNGMYGLIDFEGNEITKNIYSSIENIQPTEGKFVVSKEGKYGVIDLNGRILVKTEYDAIRSDGYYEEGSSYKKSGFIISNKTQDGYKYGYINYKGKKILDVKYNEIERISKDNSSKIYLIVSENGKYGVYRSSKNIIAIEYQAISYEEDLDVFILQKSKKMGVAKLSGKIIIDVLNDEIELNGIYLYIKSSNGNKVYDTNGNIVDINFNKYIYLTDNPNYKISITLNNDIAYYSIIGNDGTPLVNEQYRYIEYLYDNYFIATNDEGKLGVINNDGKVILEMKYSSLQKVKGKNILQAVFKGETEYYDSNLKKVENYDKDPESSSGFPTTIGNYIKEQTTLESVYYIKNSK